MAQKKTFLFFRRIAKAEGISYLVLLFIAMPLKYLADIPIAVTIVGSIHGLLFIAFCIWLGLVHFKFNKSLWWSVKAFLASIIPFGTLYMDKTWKNEELR